VLPTGFALIALALGIDAGLNPAKAWSFGPWNPWLRFPKFG
jgi:hypothetical protein